MVLTTCGMYLYGLFVLLLSIWVEDLTRLPLDNKWFRRVLNLLTSVRACAISKINLLNVPATLYFLVPTALPISLSFYMSFKFGIQSAGDDSSVFQITLFWWCISCFIQLSTEMKNIIVIHRLSCLCYPLVIYNGFYWMQRGFFLLLNENASRLLLDPV